MSSLRIVLLPNFITIISFLFINVSSINSQTKKDIDDLIVQMVNNTYNDGLNHQKMIKQSLEIIKQSEAIKYTQGIIIGNTHIAYVLHNQGEYEKSIEYINKQPNNHQYLSENPTDEIKLLILQAKNYYNLNLNSLAKRCFFKAESIKNKEKNKGLRANNLFNLYLSYDIISKDPKLTYHYLNTAKKLFKIPEYKKAVSYRQNKIKLHIAFGDYYLNKKEIDSSNYYYKAALNLLKKEKNNYLVIYIHKGFSNLYELQNDPVKALEHRLKSLELLGKNPSIEDKLDCYLSISKIYERLGDLKNEKQYRDSYTALNDSIGKIKDKARDLTIIELVDKEEEFKSTNYYYQVILIFITLLVLVTLYYSHNKYKKEKKKALSKIQKLVQYKNQKIVNQAKVVEQFTTELEKKTEKYFEELIELGKKNHTNFYNRFKELYPNLHYKLLENNTNLQLSELTLCAYIYLNFTTKEIADYSFKSLRTIQNRKYSLRKKLDISTSEDIYVWIKGLDLE